jgi:hypothetical protein
MAFYKEGLNPIQSDALMQPHKGLWIEADLTADMHMLPDNPHPNTYGLFRDLEGTLVECRFDGRYFNRASRLEKGDKIKVRGKIWSFQNGQQLFLQECDIIG